MTLLEWLKSKNRILLEMHLGILACGIVGQIVGTFIVRRQYYYAISLWFGILMAAVSVLQMYRSLDRALDAGGQAQKLIFRDYILRYVFIFVILLIIMLTEVMNPLVVFMAYMSLKVTALIQPFTHKLCNKIFHETDPIPLTPEEEPQGEAEEISEV